MQFYPRLLFQAEERQRLDRRINFDRFGKNINGPAKVDLQKVPLEQLRKKKGFL